MSLIKMATSGWLNAKDVMSKIDFKNKFQNIKQNQFTKNPERNSIISSVRGETSPSTMVMF
jgi:hypothetical protein